MYLRENYKIKSDGCFYYQHQYKPYSVYLLISCIAMFIIIIVYILLKYTIK